MYNRDNVEDIYGYACDSVMNRDDQRLVIEGLEELISECEERIDDIMREVSALDRELCLLRDRFEQVTGMER